MSRKKKLNVKEQIQYFNSMFELTKNTVRILTELIKSRVNEHFWKKLTVYTVYKQFFK